MKVEVKVSPNLIEFYPYSSAEFMGSFWCVVNHVTGLAEECESKQKAVDAARALAQGYALIDN